MMTELRGASNAKAKRELGWRPAHPSWRQGFVGGMSRTRASCSTSCGRSRSRSPTGCSAASPRPRTSSRRRCCACTGRSRRGEQIASPRAFVATVTTRLAINELRSARARRERYVGEWLPEPIVTDGRDDPARHAEIADSLSLAMLVLLESLSPEQRAVLLLHDVFDYALRARSPRSSARARTTCASSPPAPGATSRSGRPRFETTREQRDELARRFFAAAEQGDLAGLEALLAHDVELTGDGGGKVPALARTLRGRSRVARTLVTWVALVGRRPQASRCGRPRSTASPGALVLDGQQRRARRRGRSRSPAARSPRISSIVNPDKLAHLGPVGDFRSLLSSARPTPG